MPPRFLLLVALAAALLLVPATAQGHSGVRLRGVVALKDTANNLVTVRASRQAFALRVPGSLAAIRVGQRVELRGSTLRAHGNGSRVLARNVSIVSSQPLSSPASPGADDDEPADEVEIKGKLKALAPLTVESSMRAVTCSVPAGVSLAGFATGDIVEMKCDLVAGTWVLRKLEHEDDDDNSAGGPNGGDDDDDHSGPGGGDDDDSSGRGPGGGGDDD